LPRIGGPGFVHSMRVRSAIREGGRTVGAGWVVKIIK
jgi:translation elongation factor EF-Tu-like GTPase